jgi:hypothetical protein
MVEMVDHEVEIHAVEIDEMVEMVEMSILYIEIAKLIEQFV